MSNYCQKCGAKVSDTKSLCPDCEKSAHGKPKKENKALKIIIAVVVVLALSAATLIALSYFNVINIPFLSKSDSSDDNSKVTSIDSEYSNIINQYQEAVNDNLYVFSENTNNAGKHISNSLLRSAKDSKDYYTTKVYYSITDINKDNVSELLIAGGENVENIDIYSIFTFNGSESVSLFKNYPVSKTMNDRSSYYMKIYNNNVIELNVSDEIICKSYFYQIETNSKQLNFLDGYTRRVDSNSYNRINENGDLLEKLDAEGFGTFEENYWSKDKMNFEWVEIQNENIK